jgi:hypothetical protein
VLTTDNYGIFIEDNGVTYEQAKAETESAIGTQTLRRRHCLLRERKRRQPAAKYCPL